MFLPIFKTWARVLLLNTALEVPAERLFIGHGFLIFPIKAPLRVSGKAQIYA